MLGLPVGNDFKQYLLDLADVACKKANSIPRTPEYHDGVATGSYVSIMCAAHWIRDHYPASIGQIEAEISINARNCRRSNPSEGRIKVAMEYANALDQLFIEQEDFRKGEKE